jgi:hypothetical protein
MSGNAQLVEFARIPTSGARAVEHFELADQHYLVVPQLAVDVAGATSDMNGGDSSADVLVLRHGVAGGALFEEFQRLSVPGGEDAEFFRIGDRSFLAVASIRSGAGPYDYAQPQYVFEWVGERFELFQSIDGYAAKQWRHIPVGNRHFLGLAQGVALPGHHDANQPSRLYEWNGERFTEFQEVDSAWGYNWHPFTIDSQHYLAYADHVRPSVLLRWDGTRFVEVQALAPTSGRAFADFTIGGQSYLVVARLQEDSLVLRWDGEQFVAHQTLRGPGGRELAVIDTADALFLIRVNFITGTPHDPVTALNSVLYRWESGQFDVAEEFPTTGGTDVTSWVDAELGRVVAVSNSLSPQIRFATNTVVYRFATRRAA